MFGRHVELKLVKNSKKSNTTTDEAKNDSPPVDYHVLIEDAAKKIVISIVTVMAARFVFNTAEHLIVNATTKPTE